MLALLLVLINAFVLSYAPIASGIEMLGGFGGAAIGTYIVSFVSLYLGLFIAKLAAGYAKIEIAV